VRKRLTSEQCRVILDRIDHARDEGELGEVSAVVWRGHRLCWDFPLAWGFDVERWNAMWIFFVGSYCGSPRSFEGGESCLIIWGFDRLPIFGVVIFSGVSYCLSCY